MEAFFKPVDYQSEREIRIFYLRPISADKQNLDWTICDFDILHPFVEHNFKEGETPFSITRVICGPGMPYVNHNRLEIEALMKSKGIIDVEVAPSKIKHFRAKQYV